MIAPDSGHRDARSSRKRLWFGFGNYAANPSLHIGGGYVRDPNLLSVFFKTSKMEGSPVTCFMVLAAGLIALSALGFVFAWVFSLIVK
jgi:hypothetical protein